MASETYACRSVSFLATGRVPWFVYKIIIAWVEKFAFLFTEEPNTQSPFTAASYDALLPLLEVSVILHSHSALRRNPVPVTNVSHAHFVTSFDAAFFLAGPYV